MNRPEMLNKRKKVSILSIILGILAVVCVAILAFDIWFNRNYFVVEVSGTSMVSTLENGDSVYANYRKTAERGDIVIIDVSDDEHFSSDLIIKRLIAVEGDSVKAENGYVWLKKAGGEYERLTEPYVNAATVYFAEQVVGAGEMFFLGDNRSLGDSNHDSHVVGCLSFDKIVGVVPQWAVNCKSAITNWENFRTSVVKFFRGK